jgi:lipopolysaccharide cholinephosphotransferase
MEAAVLETYNSLRKLAIDNDQLYQLTDEDIRDIQRCLISMMKDIDEVCRKYHLMYAITGGAMLGAVRHQGFVPWDDDIDICMPRRDYDRFCKLFLRECSDRYWVQNIRNDRRYDLNFMKVRMKDTVFLELFDMDEEKAGLFIDIFPVENTFSNPILRGIHGAIGDGLLLVCSCVRMTTKAQRLLSYTKHSALEKSVRVKLMIGRLCSVFPLRWWLLQTERWLSIYKNHKSEWITIPSGRKHYFGELYRRTVFYPAVRMNFEEEHFLGVREPDAYLKNMYGDYMKIPPVSERERHTVLRFSLKRAHGQHKQGGNL